jgi:hypothetical protein
MFDPVKNLLKNDSYLTTLMSWPFCASAWPKSSTKLIGTLSLAFTALRGLVIENELLFIHSKCSWSPILKEWPCAWETTLSNSYSLTLCWDSEWLKICWQSLTSLGFYRITLVNSLKIGATPAGVSDLIKNRLGICVVKKTYFLFSALLLGPRIQF